VNIIENVDEENFVIRFPWTFENANNETYLQISKLIWNFPKAKPKLTAPYLDLILTPDIFLWTSEMKITL